VAEMKVDSNDAFFICFTMLCEETYNTRAAGGQYYITIKSSLIGLPPDYGHLNIMSQQLKMP
jgi:hypothetical protein